MIDIDTLSPEAIGNRIKAARDERDITQKFLAEQIFISPSTMNKIENGSQDICLNKLGQIANALDVKMEFLLGIDKDTNFVDDFIGLFEQITTSKDFLAKDDGVYSGENLIYSLDKNYIVLTGKPALFELITEIADIHGQQMNLRPIEYESRLNAAKNSYKETKKICSERNRGNSKAYFLISGEQISELVRILIKSEEAVSEVGIKQMKTTDVSKLPPLRLQINRK